MFFFDDPHPHNDNRLKREIFCDNIKNGLYNGYFIAIGFEQNVRANLGEETAENSELLTANQQRAIVDAYLRAKNECGYEFFSIDVNCSEIYNGKSIRKLRPIMYNLLTCGNYNSHSLSFEDKDCNDDFHYICADLIGGDLVTASNMIVDHINQVAQQNSSVAIVEDEIGIDFRSSSYPNGKATNLGNSSTFKIKIDPKVSEGWHKTNKLLKITEINGEKVDYSTNVSAEVYWKPERNEFEACTDTIEINKTDDNTKEIKIGDGSTITISDEYYTSKCTEKLKAKLTINELKNNTKEFNIKGGMGFPVTIQYSSDINCKYTFEK